MADTSSNLTIVQVKDFLSGGINSVPFGQERGGITMHGQLAAAIISVEDLQLLESLEDASDVTAYRAAKAEDDGTRIGLVELQAETRSATGECEKACG